MSATWTRRVFGALTLGIVKVRRNGDNYTIQLACQGFSCPRRQCFEDVRRNAHRVQQTARELRDVAAGRAVLRQAGLAGGDSPARFIAPGRKYPQPYVALPAFDRNGKSAGIWLNPLTTDDGNGLNEWK